MSCWLPGSDAKLLSSSSLVTRRTLTQEPAARRLALADGLLRRLAAAARHDHRAKRAAAERGELRFPLPVGFVYDDEGNTVIDPDGEVQAAVADVFAAFCTGGSAYQVVA